MTSCPVELMIDVDDASHLDRVQLPVRTRVSEWQSLLDGLMEPATLIERGLTEVDSLQGGTRRPLKAAAVGTNMLGLLAALALRLRGSEVVTLGRVPELLLSPNRVKGIAGWKHVWISPALAHLALVGEIGARYVCAGELSVEDVARQFGPFDMIIVGSTDPPLMPGLTRGPARPGALLDLTLGNREMEIWTATPTPSFLEKYRVRFQVGADDRVFIERATRNLAMADTLYPGWLARLLGSFEPLGMPAPGVPRLKAERLRSLGNGEAIQDCEGRETDLFATEVTR